MSSHSTKKSKVVVVGAGGLGREFLDIIEAENQQMGRWQFMGFVDDSPELRGKTLRGHRVLGGTDWFSTHEAHGVGAVVAMGENKVRREVVQRIARFGVEFPKLIHPSAILTPFVKIGEGVVIAAGCILTNNIQIKNHVILNLGVTVGHDTIVDDFVNLNPGVHVNGSNHIMEGAYIGSGATTIQGIQVGKWSTVGAGAVVVRDIPDGVVAVGVPARPIKSA